VYCYLWCLCLFDVVICDIFYRQRANRDITLYALRKLTTDLSTVSNECIRRVDGVDVVWRRSTHKVRCHRDCFLDRITRNGSTWQGLHADWATLKRHTAAATSVNDFKSNDLKERFEISFLNCEFTHHWQWQPPPQLPLEKRYRSRYGVVWTDGWNAMPPPPVISDQMPWVSKSEQNGATITIRPRWCSLLSTTEKIVFSRPWTLSVTNWCLTEVDGKLSLG